MRRHLLPTALLCLSLLLSTACSGPAGGSDDDGEDDHPEGGGQHPEAPEFTEVTVHDPSVIETEEDFWVFGSHLAAAKSEDFIQWEQTAELAEPDNPLFDDVTEELADTFEWAESDTLWAPDVVQLADGRYYMYYNACRGDEPRSAMGVAVADEIDGPYEDQGIILKSGHREGEGPSEDGTEYDPQVHPNVVDPDVFHDAEGNLWMVYGSYSGGIFLLEMDEETGKPAPDQGYGEHLMGGNHSRIEAPNMMHDPNSGYYYLFTSFGGLDADGGYNVRVARSEDPQGPYVDAEGNDMSDVKSDPEAEIFDDVSIQDYGTKLMGNHLFTASGEEGTGYVSPGHNSSHLDSETGRMHLFFHSRFPGEDEIHNVRVHEMFFNKDGWPVVAPFRYAGAESEGIEQEEVPGEYELVEHGKEITDDVPESETVTLDEDGTVSGATAGHWELTGDREAKIEADGTTYTGVFTPQWNPGSESWGLTFSVLSEEGVSLWGSSLE